MKIVGCTACPSGVAHTYMAAEALILSGEKYGIEVCIETQGGCGIENKLRLEDIEEAVCVILSNDINIEGKKVLRMGVSDLITKSDAIMAKIKKTF